MENPTFEESLQELEKIVMQLEQGDVPLESALDSFKRGMELSKHCQDTLAKASSKGKTYQSQSIRRSVSYIGWRWFTDRRIPADQYGTLGSFS